MAKLFAFPIVVLRQLIKKALMYLPPEHRKVLTERLKDAGYRRGFEEKATRLVVVIMSAKTVESEDEFTAELADGLDFPLNVHEHFLFDGFLGGQKNLLLDFVKKGIPPERLAKIKDGLARAKSVGSAPPHA